ncbi:MAG: hypothetical protein JWM82_1177 [Myxococcales bacterium]|nr:hypothetical protein [Myxococcales bacterium]
MSAVGAARATRYRRGMCRRITCSECGKPSFAGCGLHIESVLGDVPEAQRCLGHATKAPAPVVVEPVAPAGEPDKNP